MGGQWHVEINHKNNNELLHGNMMQWRHVRNFVLREEGMAGENHGMERKNEGNEAHKIPMHRLVDSA